MIPLPHPPLLLITDRHQATRPLASVISAACSAGIRWISVREKDLPADAQMALCREILAVAAPLGARVTLHGAADLAAAAGCGGVHLPAGASGALAREVLGADALIGQSIHSLGEAEAADPQHVDYVVAGPAFLTVSKPGYGPALRGEGLARLKAACRVPLVALGGIDPETLAECRTAGMDGVAVMGGVMRAPDPGDEVRALLDVWNGRYRPAVTRD